MISGFRNLEGQSFADVMLDDLEKCAESSLSVETEEQDIAQYWSCVTMLPHLRQVKNVKRQLYKCSLIQLMFPLTATVASRHQFLCFVNVFRTGDISESIGLSIVKWDCGPYQILLTEHLMQLTAEVQTNIILYLNQWLRPCGGEPYPVQGVSFCT